MLSVCRNDLNLIIQQGKVSLVKLDLEAARRARTVEEQLTAEFLKLPLHERKNVLERVAVAVLATIPESRTSGAQKNGEEKADGKDEAGVDESSSKKNWEKV